MADRVYPSATPVATATTIAIPKVGPNQATNTVRPPYRPQPPPRRLHRLHRRGCCCTICLCLTLLIFFLILLAAIAGALFYAIYRPHHPSFSVSSLHLSTFNFTDNKTLVSAFDLTLTARNPNKRITFTYDRISATVLTGDVDVGGGAFPGFVHGKRNVTTLGVVITGRKVTLPDGTDIARLRSSRSLVLKIELDTKVKAKLGKIKTKKMRIRVTCDGIRVLVPTGRLGTSASSNGKCKVDPRIKILKWTV